MTTPTNRAPYVVDGTEYQTRSAAREEARELAGHHRERVAIRRGGTIVEWQCYDTDGQYGEPGSYYTQDV